MEARMQHPEVESLVPGQPFNRRAFVQRMKAALEASSDPEAKASRFIVYPDAGHAFNADYRPSYVEKDARDGWQQCLAWFRQHGVA